MSQLKRISVVIPSYNHVAFINDTLHSIFQQTLVPQKLLVIDDGSQDNSLQIIEEALKKCPFECELIARENKGLSATLNEGLAKTNGEYFAYLGSDDIWLPTFLEERVKLLESRPQAVLAFGHAYLINEQNEIIDCSKDWTTYSDGNMLPMLLNGIVPLSPGVVYRRESLEKYGWNENSILEDYELYLKLTAEGEFALDTNVLCAWRQHNYNVSKDFTLMLEEWLTAQNRVAKQLNISSSELNEIQEKLKFNSGVDLIRAGKKLEAIRLIWENRNGAKSLSKAAGILLRLATPQFVFQRIRKQKMAQNIKNFGKVNIKRLI